MKMILIIGAIGLILLLLLAPTPSTNTPTTVQGGALTQGTNEDKIFIDPLPPDQISKNGSNLDTGEGIPIIKEFIGVDTINLFVGGSYAYVPVVNTWTLQNIEIHKYGFDESLKNVFGGFPFSFIPTSGETKVLVQLSHKDVNGIMDGKIYELIQNKGTISQTAWTKDFSASFKGIPSGKYLVAILIFENDILKTEKYIEFNG